MIKPDVFALQFLLWGIEIVGILVAVILIVDTLFGED